MTDIIEASKIGIEIWKDIDGYEGYYQISNLGRVKSLPRVIIRKDGKPYSCRERILSPGVDKKEGGRLFVMLCRDVKKVHKIHQLVLNAFVGPCPDYQESCHNDGNPSNNCLYNLRYDTSTNNNADKKRHGTISSGERNGMAKLTEDAVRHIRNGTTPIKTLAELYGVSETHVYDVKAGRYWKDAYLSPAS